MAQLPAVFDDPVALAVLTLVVAALVYWQRDLTWREYQTVHQIKLRVLPLLDRHTNLFVVSRKGDYTDPEFLLSMASAPEETFNTLRDAGGSPHLINAVKMRPAPVTGTRQYAIAHLVWSHDDGSQTEAYLFSNNGQTDVYAHHEAGVRNPRKHYENTNQQDGDPRGVVKQALAS